MLTTIALTASEAQLLQPKHFLRMNLPSHYIRSAKMIDQSVSDNDVKTIQQQPNQVEALITVLEHLYLQRQKTDNSYSGKSRRIFKTVFQDLAKKIWQDRMQKNLKKNLLFKSNIIDHRHRSYGARVMNHVKMTWLNRVY